MSDVSTWTGSITSIREVDDLRKNLAAGKVKEKEIEDKLSSLTVRLLYM